MFALKCLKIIASKSSQTYSLRLNFTDTTYIKCKQPTSPRSISINGAITLWQILKLASVVEIPCHIDKFSKYWVSFWKILLHRELSIHSALTGVELFCHLH